MARIYRYVRAILYWMLAYLLQYRLWPKLININDLFMVSADIVLADARQYFLIQSDMNLVISLKNVFKENVGHVYLGNPTMRPN